MSGWLVGFPFTSAPIAFFLALNQGAAFAAAAAAGTMTGAISQAAFCLAYAWLARRWGSAIAGGAGCLAFALSTVALERLTVPLLASFVTVLAALVLALRLMPGDVGRSRAAAGSPPRWDIPARMVVATVFVLLLTEMAPALGPHLTGLLAPFPLYAAVLTVFAHRLEGATPAVAVLRGLLLALFAFAGFFLVIAALIERAGMALAFAAAVVLTLGLQAGALWALGRIPSARRCP